MASDRMDIIVRHRRPPAVLHPYLNIIKVNYLVNDAHVCTETYPSVLQLPTLPASLPSPAKLKIAQQSICWDDVGSSTLWKFRDCGSRLKAEFCAAIQPAADVTSA
eukprot:SM000005S17328  [mRNA]  locus=s5:1428100:1430049:+ [translate_table: standard]